jgi:hypothetical protein
VPKEATSRMASLPVSGKKMWGKINEAAVA